MCYRLRCSYHKYDRYKYTGRGLVHDDITEWLGARSVYADERAICGCLRRNYNLKLRFTITSQKHLEYSIIIIFEPYDCTPLTPIAKVVGSHGEVINVTQACCLERICNIISV